LLGGMAKNKRGISPVVATVILVAVTIVVAVAVSYWMGGIASLYTRFEKVEITTAYAVWDASAVSWNVTIKLKNTGSADATVTGLLINGRPWDDASYGGNVTYSGGDVTLPIGQEVPINMVIKKGGSFTSGVSVDIKLHTAAGQDYPRIVTLP